MQVQTAINRPKKIMLVSNTARSFRLFRRDLILALVAQGHDVYCMAPFSEDAQGIRELGAVFLEIPLNRSGINPLHEFAAVYKMCKHIADIHPDFLISYTIKPNTYVPMLAKLFKVPCLAVVTGLGYAFMNQSPRGKVARKVFLTGLSFATHVWFLNKADKDVLVGHNENLAMRADILPGEGIDTEFFKSSAHDDENNGTTVFLMIARLLWDKGVREYADAAKAIKAAGYNAQFRVLGELDAGNPTGVSAYEWQAITADGSIQYLGSDKDVRPHIESADCVVLPSYREGVPMVLLEAGAMARPVITTDVPGCQDVVRHGENGLICAAKDAKSLERSFINFLELASSERLKMGEAGRSIVIDHFAKDIIVEKYNRLLADSLNSQPYAATKLQY